MDISPLPTCRRSAVSWKNMADDLQNYVTVTEAAARLGISPLYARILAGAGLLPAHAIGERSGNWTGDCDDAKRAKMWLIDPRPESRDWRTYQEAADALGIERSRIRSLVHHGKLQVIETGDDRLKVVTLASLDARLAEHES